MALLRLPRVGLYSIASFILFNIFSSFYFSAHNEGNSNINNSSSDTASIAAGLNDNAVVYTYTTIRNGYWSSPSTWAGGAVPNEYFSGDVININHQVTWNQGNDVYIQNGTLNVCGVFIIPNHNIKMESYGGVINLNNGLIIIQNDNLENKYGRVNFNGWSGVQLCNGNYTDESSAGTHGNGYIYAQNGNIEDKNYGNFSTGVKWCSSSGDGVGMPTGENCGVAYPAGGCNAIPAAFQSLCAEICNNGTDDDGDGLADCNDPDCGKPSISSISTNNPTCPLGTNNGTIYVYASGSNKQYRLHTTGWQTSPSFTGLSSGSYTVYVQNSSTGCQITSSAYLSSPSCVEDCTNGTDDDGDGLIDCNDPNCGKPVISNVNSNDPPCPIGSGGGSIAITATGSNLEYRLDNGSWQSSSIFNDLAIGSYTVYVRNSSTACEASQSNVTINTPTCVENCHSGIDEDSNGLIDCADPNCAFPSGDEISFSRNAACTSTTSGKMIIGTSDGTMVVPDGYVFNYLFVRNSDLTILDYGTDLEFSTTENGIYSVYTMIYSNNPFSTAYFDSGSMTMGVTTTTNVDAAMGDCALLQKAGTGTNNQITISDCAKLGDFVWLDADGDGWQDSTEVGIKNFEVRLEGTSASNLAVYDTTSTDYHGFYEFDVPPGSYQVNVTVSPTQKISVPDAIGDDGSDANDTSAIPTCSDLDGDGLITICHNDTTTMEISESEWATHQGHGDTCGPCGDFRTISDGKWSKSATWEGGNKPSEDISGDKVVINHIVTVNNEVTVKNNGVLFINNGSLELKDVRLNIEKGTVHVVDAELIAGKELELNNNQAKFFVDNSTVTVKKTYKMAGGARYFKNAVVELTENYQNDAGDDNLDNVTMEVLNGNFQNDGSSNIIANNSRIYVKNGDFQNNADIDGEDLVIWTKNGNLQNSGSWNAPIMDYCISGSIDNIPSSDEPSSEDCGNIGDYFDLNTNNPIGSGNSGGSGNETVVVEDFDNDIDSITGYSPIITLAANEQDLSVDIGLASFLPPEECGNGIDDDGDGLTDCEDPDCYLFSNTGGTDNDNDGIGDYCDIDDDNDGIRDIDEGFMCPTFDESIWVNDEDRQIIEISNINGTPTQVNIVTINTTETVGDIGFAPDGTLYVVTFNSKILYAVDLNTGNLTAIASIPFTEANPDPNSISFDERGFAYVGGSDSDAIWRVDPETGTSTLWHDFGAGDSSGDFIFLNGRVYVSWEPTGHSSNVRLYEITIDANNNYLSHQDLGILPSQTYGLSSDGSDVLYGGRANGNIYTFIPPTSPVATISTSVVFDLSGNDQIYGMTSIVEAVGNGCVGIDTDADGLEDHLDLDSDGDGCYDKIEAGVTGFTTNGTITDSLAASTSGEVGANGLDDDIENNDTQSATTSGSYTITQTNSGTNDFQDAAVYSPNCHCLFTAGDTDGDGICDLDDIDDDNDGIRDVDECALSLSNTWTSSTNNATGQVGDMNITVSHVLDANTANFYTNETFGTTNLWSNPNVVGAPSLRVGHSWDTTHENGQQASVDAGTTTFTFDFGELVENPIVHVDRLGGSSTTSTGTIPYYSATNEFTLLTPGVTMVKLAGNSQFIVESDKFYRTPNVDMGISPPTNEANNTALSAAAGSIQFLGAFNTLTFSVTGVGPDLERESIELIFESCKADTDSDGIVDRLDLDSDDDGCYDKMEAGVTGYTTNGSITDSLAASTAAEVGANGLDDDIESDDSQTATTSGSHSGNYDIVQTNTGTNDFQDASINIACDDPCNPFLSGNLDTDGDNISDICDIDDDNDGIRDVDEGLCIEDGLTSLTAFTSIGYARNITTAGVYYFNISGQTFSTYVDANGYVQIAIDFGNGVGNLPQGTTLNQSSRGILTPAVLATLTETQTVRLSHSGGQFDVSTTNSTIIGRIQSNTTLHRGVADNTINNNWTGTNAAYITIDATCSSSAGNSLHQSIVHLCGMTNGTHWMPSLSQQRLRHGLGELANTQSMSLWVRGASVSCEHVDTDLDGTPDYLDLDSDGDGCYDKIEAGVTGFTTNGSITDSLAASTAVEVGTNGLDDDIESDDTQSATTSGSYTVTQTNSGTNDFQDSSISLGCAEICGDGFDNDGDGLTDCEDPDCYLVSNTGGDDLDGDGIGDACDIDDDNDGVLDANESEDSFDPVMVLAQKTAQASGSGIGGLPSINIDIPQGSNENRALLLYFIAERDHTGDGTPNSYGDNYAINVPGSVSNYDPFTQDNMFTISSSSHSISASYNPVTNDFNYRYKTSLGIGELNAKYSIEYTIVYLLESDLDALCPSGFGNIDINFDLLGTNLPASGQDETLLGVIVLDNVKQGLASEQIFTEFSDGVGLGLNSTSSTLSALVDADHSPKSDFDGVLMLGHASNENLTNGSRYGYESIPGYNLVTDGQILNNAIPSNTYTYPGVSSEADGFTYSLQFGLKKDITIGTSTSLSFYNSTSNTLIDNAGFSFIKIQSAVEETDGDGLPDHRDLDSDGDGCFDIAEAGVSGFTTNGSIRDSLAASTGLEVGANGLANNIESDDTQNATVNYTVVQTNTGVNDFQDASISTGCVEICGDGLDNDSDGLIDCDDPDCITSPTINLSLTTACVNEVITISSSDLGVGTTYSWNFGNNASPATASGIGPHNVSYTSCGSKTASLTVQRNSCSITVDSIITIQDTTDPVWDVAPSNLVLECNSSQNLNDSISLWLGNHGGGTVSDNCNNSFIITNDYTVLSADCGTTASTSVRFTARDSCGNTAISTASISILDTEGPSISIVDDITVDCDNIPVAPSPTVADSCDTSPTLAYQEVTVYHPNANWRSSSTCDILHAISAVTYNDQGTPGDSSDDEMRFTLTVLGQNTSAGWSANVNGTLISGTYQRSYNFGPLLSGGSILSFTIIDDSDPACTRSVTIDAADF